MVPEPEPDTAGAAGSAVVVCNLEEWNGCRREKIATRGRLSANMMSSTHVAMTYMDAPTSASQRERFYRGLALFNGVLVACLVAVLVLPGRGAAALVGSQPLPTASGYHSLYSSMLADAKYIDLTHAIFPGMPTWPAFDVDALSIGPSMAGSDGGMYPAARRELALGCPSLPARSLTGPRSLRLSLLQGRGLYPKGRGVHVRQAGLHRDLCHAAHRPTRHTARSSRALERVRRDHLRPAAHLLASPALRRRPDRKGGGRAGLPRAGRGFLLSPSEFI